MPETADKPADHLSGPAVAEAAKAGEPDRYLAALLAPAGARDALVALAAFAAELARIPFAAAREPAMGEIRLQWWRDVLALPAHERTGSEVADAVRVSMSDLNLPLAWLEGMVEGRAVQLEPGPLPGDPALRDHLWKTEGAQFALALQVLGGVPDEAARSACAAAGDAYGLARLAMLLPRHLAMGRIPMSQGQLDEAGLSPADLLAGAEPEQAVRLMGGFRTRIHDALGRARALAGGLPRGAKVAFLPLALVPTYVRSVERTAAEGLRAEAGVAPLNRATRIALAHWLGRF